MLGQDGQGLQEVVMRDLGDHCGVQYAQAAGLSSSEEER